MRKCLSGFVSCFRHTNHLFLPLFSSYLCERIRQKGREEINCILNKNVYAKPSCYYVF